VPNNNLRKRDRPAVGLKKPTGPGKVELIYYV
jgi:hypothetical protein